MIALPHDSLAIPYARSSIAGLGQTTCMAYNNSIRFCSFMICLTQFHNTARIAVLDLH